MGRCGGATRLSATLHLFLLCRLGNADGQLRTHAHADTLTQSKPDCQQQSRGVTHSELVSARSRIWEWVTDWQSVSVAVAHPVSVWHRHDVPIPVPHPLCHAVLLLIPVTACGEQLCVHHDHDHRRWRRDIAESRGACV
jgi:hypothetical protein